MDISTLDIHGQMLMEEFYEKSAAYSKLEQLAEGMIKSAVKSADLIVPTIEGRVKTEESLFGKLKLKGGKYRTMHDVTDVVGLRVITFYTSDVDKVASLLESLFTIDWNNSVDKRKILHLDTFGYLSLHYICYVPKERYFDPECPELNQIPFEVQIRTLLQHMWANMYHDTGYKSGVEVPKEYLRSLNRLAGMLELADDEFNRIRTELNEYRRKVQALVADGKFDVVSLNRDTFESYLKLKPFNKLTARIAEINQAEIYPADLTPYLGVLKDLGFATLGDVEKFINDYSEDAYIMARHILGRTDLDIISANVGIQNLCAVYITRNGGGVSDLKRMYDILDGEPSEKNLVRAQRIVEDATFFKDNKTDLS